jgi:hypothetical protein
VKLASHAAGAKLLNGELMIPLPAVEAGLAHSLPEPGSATAQMKVLQRADARSLSLRLSAPANTLQSLFLRVNDPKVHVRIEGAELLTGSSELRVQFPAEGGYTEREVKLSW